MFSKGCRFWAISVKIADNMFYLRKCDNNVSFLFDIYIAELKLNEQFHNFRKLSMLSARWLGILLVNIWASNCNIKTFQWQFEFVCQFEYRVLVLYSSHRSFLLLLCCSIQLRPSVLEIKFLRPLKMKPIIIQKLQTANLMVFANCQSQSWKIALKFLLQFYFRQLGL